MSAGTVLDAVGTVAIVLGVLLALGYAGLLVARIVASTDTEEGERLRAALTEHAAELNAQAQAKGARLRERMAADR